MLEICEEDSGLFETEYGLYQKFKSVDGIDSGFQSQIVRLFSHKLLPNSNLLMSDIDMFPLSIDYFEKNSELATDEQVLIYTGQPYKQNPYYAMCYILGKGSVMSKYLGIDNETYEEYVRRLHTDYKGAWNTDENFLYDSLEKCEDKVILRDRTNLLGTRVYRPRFVYTEEQIKNGHFIDCHSLRPYQEHKVEIDKLMNIIIGK